MLKLDHLIKSCKDHLMFSYDAAAAHCRDTDLCFFSLFALFAAVISIGICIVKCLIHGIGKCKCRTARRIQFLVVVFFDDLHIKTGRC